MKKFIAMALALVLTAGIAIGGTTAYLTDEASDVNVMTLGKVKIEQHEYQRVQNADGTYATATVDDQTSYVLEDFQQAKPLLPIVGDPSKPGDSPAYAGYDDTIVRMTQVDSYGSMQVFAGKNAVDKFVTVENTGWTDAYVRTIVAIEVGTGNASLIGSSYHLTWAKEPVGSAEINGNTYYLLVYNYLGAQLNDGTSRHGNGILPAGDTTYPNLSQIYIKSEATNEDMAALDGNKNGTLDVLVLSQAVQAKGFADAATALNTAFGEVNAANAAAWFGSMEAPVLVSTDEELRDAIDKGGNITLAKNLELDADNTLTVAAGKSVELNLNGKTITSVADGTDNRELFLVKGNMTVSNGTIDIRVTQNQGWNAMSTVFDVTAGGVLNIENATIINNGGTDMNFCVHLNNWGEVTLNVTNSTLKSTYCAVRVFNSGYDMNNVSIHNSALTGSTRAFWVHNYIGDLNSAQHSDEAIKARLNLDIYGNGNTFNLLGEATAPIRFGFSNTVYFDANGNEIIP